MFKDLFVDGIKIIKLLSAIGIGATLDIRAKKIRSQNSHLSNLLKKKIYTYVLNQGFGETKQDSNRIVFFAILFHTWDAVM